MFAETGTSYAAATAAAQAALQLSHQQKPGVCSALCARFGASTAQTRQNDGFPEPIGAVNIDHGRRPKETATGSGGSSWEACDHQSEATACPEDVMLKRGAALSLRQRRVQYVKKSCLPATSKGKHSQEAAAHRRIDKMSRKSPHSAETSFLSATQNSQRVPPARQTCSRAMSVWQLPSGATLGLQHFFLFQNCLVWQMLSQVQLGMSDAVGMFALLLVLAYLVLPQSHQQHMSDLPCQELPFSNSSISAGLPPTEERSDLIYGSQPANHMAEKPCYSCACSESDALHLQQ